MSTRSRKAEKIYSKYRKTENFGDTCIFCKQGKDEQPILETKSFVVIKNIFPYTQWDGQGVEDHLMIVPKKHTDTLNDLTSNEAVEYVDLLGSYESIGYSVYSRARNSTRKTVVHQHTHLIKLDDKTKNIIVYSKKPYFRIVR